MDVPWPNFWSPEFGTKFHTESTLIFWRYPNFLKTQCWISWAIYDLSHSRKCNDLEYLWWSSVIFRIYGASRGPFASAELLVGIWLALHCVLRKLGAFKIMVLSSWNFVITTSRSCTISDIFPKTERGYITVTMPTWWSFVIPTLIVHMANQCTKFEVSTRFSHSRDILLGQKN